MTKAERRQIEGKVRKSGLSQQAYLLQAALEEELRPILAELRGWGRNLNQLTVLAHSGRVQTVYLQELTAALAKTYEAVNRLLTEKDGVISCGNVQLHPGTYTHATRQKQDEAAQTMGNILGQVI